MIADWTTLGWGSASAIEIAFATVSFALLNIGFATTLRALTVMRTVNREDYNGALRALAKDTLVRCWCRTGIQAGFLAWGVNALTAAPGDQAAADTHRAVSWATLMFVQACIAITVLYGIRSHDFILSELVKGEQEKQFAAHSMRTPPTERRPS